MSGIYKESEQEMQRHRDDVRRLTESGSELSPLPGSTPTIEDVHKAMAECAEKLMSEQMTLPAEYSKLIEDNIDDLVM